MLSFFSYLSILHYSLFFFFFNDTATTEIYTLSLHDALPISVRKVAPGVAGVGAAVAGVDDHGVAEAEAADRVRSEEHTSELQSQSNLVCRLLLEKKKKNRQDKRHSQLDDSRAIRSRLRVH